MLPMTMQAMTIRRAKPSSSLGRGRSHIFIVLTSALALTHDGVVVG